MTKPKKPQPRASPIPSATGLCAHKPVEGIRLTDAMDEISVTLSGSTFRPLNGARQSRRNLESALATAVYDAVANPYCTKARASSRTFRAFASKAHSTPSKRQHGATRRRPLPTGRRASASIDHPSPLFQDVYAWAGKFRTVRMEQGRDRFCYPENIAREMTALFSDLKHKRHLINLSPKQFAAEAAHFLATLNAIHPFLKATGEHNDLLSAFGRRADIRFT